MNLDDHRHADLSLDDLVRVAGELLPATATDGRVRARPDARTVRYYQTLGLVSRPRYVGRSARYGWLHLLQVLAVKLLQGQGHTLSQLQGTLAGVDPGQLEAAVRDTLGAPAAPTAAPPRSLVSAQLAPGVIVTVDPDLVPDPHSLIRRLAAALPGDRP